MGAPYSGVNGLIYVSGLVIAGSNTWSISAPTSVVAMPQMGDAYVRKGPGQREWSGSLSAWDQADANPLHDVAQSGIAEVLLIYPTRATVANYWHGSAVFGQSAGGGTNAGVSAGATFNGTGDLTAFGWS